MLATERHFFAILQQALVARFVLFLPPFLRAMIPRLIGQPLDRLRQLALEIGLQRLPGEWPPANFQNPNSVASFMADLMEMHFVLTVDPELPNLRNIHTEADVYPRKRLLDYLLGKALQL